MASPRLQWDLGTAYDLFVSLEVLHQPDYFGAPRAWAASIRARLPAAERDILEQGQRVIHVPLHWVYHLPEPKDGAAALWSLGQVPPAERLPALALSPEMHDGYGEVLRGVVARGAWNEQDMEALWNVCQFTKEHAPSNKELTEALELWSRAAEFGERYLEALRAYQQAFFAEEEGRILPSLREALARAQQLAEQLPLPDLLEELSQGLRFAELPEVSEAVLAPSYWCTPLMFFGKADPERPLWLFGARPPDAALVAGQAVPDAMLRTLEALSDPTRLRILHYLSQEPLSPVELARRLRLRAPTVTHHLNVLRLAGLVRLTLEKDSRRRYAARSEAIAATFGLLQRFLGDKGAD